MTTSTKVLNQRHILHETITQIKKKLNPQEREKKKLACLLHVRKCEQHKLSFLLHMGLKRSQYSHFIVKYYIEFSCCESFKLHTKLTASQYLAQKISYSNYMIFLHYKGLVMLYQRLKSHLEGGRELSIHTRFCVPKRIQNLIWLKTEKRYLHHLYKHPKRTEIYITCRWQFFQIIASYCLKVRYIIKI